MKNRQQQMMTTILAALLCMPMITMAAPSHLEEQGAALRNILEMQQETAVMIGNTDVHEEAARALEQLEQLTWEDWAVFDGMEESLSNLQSQQKALNEQIRIIEEHYPNLEEAVQQSLQYSSPSQLSVMASNNLNGLTDPNYGSICSSNPFGEPPNTPNRSDRDAKQALVIGITVSDELLIVAEGVKEQADVACNTIVAGFNPQNLACFASTALYIGAKVANKALRIAFSILSFCDAIIDGAEIEGAFERTADIYNQNLGIDSDLATHDANIDGDLVAHDTNIDGDLAAHDSNIDGDLAAHDSNIDGDLAAHDSNIDGDLAAHDSNIDGDLVAHDTEVKALIAAHDTEVKTLIATHDTEVKALIAAHDAEVKALIDAVQAVVDSNGAKLDEALDLLITPPGRRPGYPRKP